MASMVSFRGSEVHAVGRAGSYAGKFDCVGFGYRMPTGEVVRSAGNGWFYEVDDLKGFVADGGDSYKNSMRRGPIATAKGIVLVSEV